MTHGHRAMSEEKAGKLIMEARAPGSKNKSYQGSIFEDKVNGRCKNQ